MVVKRAPNPPTPIRTPCPSAPTFRISTANTGIIGIYDIPKKLMKKVIDIRKRKMLFLNINLTPSIRSLILELWDRSGDETFRERTIMAIVKKPAEDIRKDVAVPANVMMRPAAAGATMRVPVQMDVFNATAFIMTLG